MKVRTNELQGASLDWAVAKCKGESVRIAHGRVWATYSGMMAEPLEYSKGWDLAGPIVEREQLAVWYDRERSAWVAATEEWMNLPVESPEFESLPFPWSGPTPLIAAMRCYVASKMGDEIEVPDELVK